MILRLAVLGAVLAAGGPAAFAHQVDEYLQTSFIALTKGSASVEMFLTPGVAVLPAVLRAIDSDGDGTISEAEQRAYAERVVRDLSVTLNGVSLRPRLLAANFPSVEDMKEGLGTIHLELKLDLARHGSSRRLRWENRHQSRISAYQVNCLMPADPSIHILSDHRNYSQSIYEMEYSDGGTGATTADSAGRWALRLGLVALLALPLSW